MRSVVDRNVVMRCMTTSTSPLCFHGMLQGEFHLHLYPFYVRPSSHKPMSIQRSIKWNLLYRVMVTTVCTSPRAACVQPGYCSLCSDCSTLRDGRPTVRISVKTGYFIFSRTFRPSLGPTQCVPGAYVGWGGGKGSGRELLCHLVSRLKTSGAVTPFSLYAFMVWTGTEICLRVFPCL